MICGWGATTSQPANQRNAKIFHIWRKEMDLATEMAGKASVSGLQHCAEIYAPLAQHTTRPMKWQHCSSCSQRSPATTNQSHALDHKYKSTKYNGFYSACAFVCMCVWKSFLVILYFWLYPWSAHYPFTTLACKFVCKCGGEACQCHANYWYLLEHAIRTHSTATVVVILPFLLLLLLQLKHQPQLFSLSANCWNCIIALWQRPKCA